ncbi:MAG: phosphopentomutase, partial [Armatimonadota bacterium]|nr:phosphopentomutase [Armatimonadota bacterium]
MELQRCVVVVLDGLGVGELPDADQYGDRGSATLQNTARAVGGLRLVNLQRLGLGNVVPVDGVPPAEAPAACFGRMAERSPGKDSTTGHWEL